MLRRLLFRRRASIWRAASERYARNLLDEACARTESQRLARSECQRLGARPARGFRKLSAYIRGKVRGTRTPATATSADSNSCSRRGAASAAFSVPTSYRRANSSFAHTLFTDETATPGTNGELPERAA